MSVKAEDTVTPDKQALRRRLRAQRRSAAPQRDRSADADAIAAVAGKLLDRVFPERASSAPPYALPRHLGQSIGAQPGTGEHPAYDGLACVAIYRSLPTEPPTPALAEMLHSRQVTVIVPETLPDLDLEWHELLADGSEGPRLGPDGINAAGLILTPALSVDRTGTRLGQGGGSYDRALGRRRGDAVIVAIINDEEYVEGPLPFDPHDVRVNGIITPGQGFSEITDRESADGGSVT